MSKCFQVAGYFVFLLIFFDRGLRFRIGQLMVSLLTGARVSSSCFDLRDIHDFFRLPKPDDGPTTIQRNFRIVCHGAPQPASAIVREAQHSSETVDKPA